MRISIITTFLICVSSPICLAQEVLMNEDFETDLSRWDVPGHGVLVPDPLNPGNQVLSFTHTAAGGDMWSMALPVDASTTYVLSFRYLGYGGGGGDTGGYLWLVDPLYGNVSSCPVWGTHPDNSNYELIDDRQWHTYQIVFQVTDYFDPIGGTLQITCEDWNGAAGIDPPPNIAGDAFFDDIQLYELGAVANEIACWGSVKALYR